MAKSSREFLYGLNPAFEALRSGRRKLVSAYLNEATAGSSRLRKLQQMLQEHNVPVEMADKQKLHQLCKSREHQGVVIRCGTYPYADTESLLGAQRILLLDNVEDPHNVGAILRSAEIFGFHDVFLPNKGVPEVYPSVVKVSAGAAEFLRIARDRQAQNYAKLAAEHGYKILALDAKGDTDLRGLPASLYAEKLLLVIGGEDKSVRQFILNMADHILRVEQQGHVNSLNASVAAGIAMFQLAPQN